MKLATMNVEQLMQLKTQIETELRARAQEIKRNLEAIGGINGHRPSHLKGRKVPPKYKGPGGETWAGRGAMPRWLTALVGKNRRKAEKYRVQE